MTPLRAGEGEGRDLAGRVVGGSEHLRHPGSGGRRRHAPAARGLSAAPRRGHREHQRGDCRLPLVCADFEHSRITEEERMLTKIDEVQIVLKALHLAAVDTTLNSLDDEGRRGTQQAGRG